MTFKSSGIKSGIDINEIRGKTFLNNSIRLSNKITHMLSEIILIDTTCNHQI